MYRQRSMSSQSSQSHSVSKMIMKRIMALTPLVKSAMTPERLELAAAGSWTAAYSVRLEQLVDTAAREAGTARRVAIDLGQVEELDTLGAWLLERLGRRFKLDGKEAELTG